MVAHSLWHIDPATSIIQSEEINPSDDAILLDFVVFIDQYRYRANCIQRMVPVSAYDRMKYPIWLEIFFPIKYGYSLIARDNKIDTISCIRIRTKSPWINNHHFITGRAVCLTKERA